MEGVTNRAVVLARGLGRRMREANAGTALDEKQRRAADVGMKALMPIAGRPFLDYVLSAIADAGLTRVALVVAPDHDSFRRYYVEEHPPTRLQIDFVVQPHAHGTADAVAAAEQWTTGKPFVVMNADNLYRADVLQRLATVDEPALLVFTREDLLGTSNILPERVQAFALIQAAGDGYLADIIEKPAPDALESAGPSAGVSMNCWRFDSRIFRSCREVPRSPRGEFELPDAVRLAIRGGVRFRAIPACGPVLDLSTRTDAVEVERRLATTPARP